MLDIARACVLLIRRTVPQLGLFQPEILSRLVFLEGLKGRARRFTHSVAGGSDRTSSSPACQVDGAQPKPRRARAASQ